MKYPVASYTRLVVDWLWMVSEPAEVANTVAAATIRFAPLMLSEAVSPTCVDEPVGKTCTYPDAVVSVAAMVPATALGGTVARRPCTTGTWNVVPPGTIPPETREYRHVPERLDALRAVLG